MVDELTALTRKIEALEERVRRLEAERAANERLTEDDASFWGQAARAA